MDKNSTSTNPVPDQTTSPEEDATLLAIEALEARSVDPNPRPWNAPREIPVPARPATPPVAPKVIEPVVPNPATQTLQSHTELKVAPLHANVQPAPAEIKLTPPPVAPTPAPVTKPQPKKHATPSEEMAQELATAPTSKAFQFFINQKPPRKPFIIIGSIVVVIGLGVAAYFTLR
jgi:hypothetical protein